MRENLRGPEESLSDEVLTATLGRVGLGPFLRRLPKVPPTTRPALSRL